MPQTPVGYYDRTPQHPEWKRLLFVPGVSIQVAELNEIQAVVQTNLEQLASSFYREGGVVAGCSVVVDVPTVTITPGRIYALGIMHDIPEGVVTVTGTGEENIGIVITDNVVNEFDDPDLSDPAIGGENFLKPGAHRLTYSYAYAVNNPNAITIAQVINGVLNQVYEQSRPVIDTILKLLATRTLEESGSYTVIPFKIELRTLDARDINALTHLQVIVRGGVGYINGWRTENTIYYKKADRPVDSQIRYDEQHTYTTGTDIYTLFTTPVRELVSISATVETGSFTMVRGQIPNTQDEIPEQYQPAVSIVSITGFTITTDFFLSGNYIDWSPAGAEPATGATYTVVLRYNKQMVRGVRTLTEITSETRTRGGTANGTDNLVKSFVQSVVSVIGSDNTVYRPILDYTVNLALGQISWAPAGTEPAANATYTVRYWYWNPTVEGDYLARNSFVNATNVIQYDKIPTALPSGTAIDFTKQISLSPTGDNPVTATPMLVTYAFTLPRVDIVAIDKRGVVNIYRGSPATHPTAPSVDPEYMPIAKLQYKPEAATDKDVTIRYYDNQRLTMVQLRSMLRLVHDLQYNQGVFQLHQEAIDIPRPTDKRGVFADAFYTPKLADITHPNFACTFDPMIGAIMLPQLVETHIPTVNTTTGVVQRFPGNGGSYYMLNYTEVVIIQQPYATNHMQVNPYSLVNLGAVIILTPAADEWQVETTQYQTATQVITLPNDRIIRNQVMVHFHGGRVGEEYVKNGVIHRYVTFEEWVRYRHPRGYQGGWFFGTGSETTTEVTERIETVDQFREIMEEIEIEPIPLTREVQVDVEGKRYIPEEDNVTLYIDGKRYDTTPTGSYQAGTEGGTLRADTDGRFTGEFLFPAGLPGGEHLIEMAGESPGVGAGSRAEAMFWAQGMHKAITQTTTLVTVLQRVKVIENITATDPLAQTFMVDEAAFISSIDLFFKSKPSNNTDPVEVTLMDTINGVPGKNVLGTVQLLPNQVLLSDNAQTATQFTFPMPVYVEPNTEYCFVVKCDVESYVVHISEVGKRDPINGWVNKNPHSGVLLRSANMRTWSADQNSDLKFTMRRCSFTSLTGQVVYNQLNMTDPRSRFEWMQTFIDLTDTAKLTFQYSTNGTVWTVFNPFLEEDLGRAFETIWMRVNFVGTEKLSPLLYNNPKGRFYSWTTPGAYINRTFETRDQDIRYIDVYLDTDIPTGCTMTLQLKLDNGAWLNMTYDPLDDLVLDQKFTERHFRYDTGSDLTLHQAIQARVNMTSDAIYKTPRGRRLRVLARTI